MKCGRCETDNREGYRFCIQCGEPLARECAACHFRNEPAASFCGKCGTALADTVLGPDDPEPGSRDATFTDQAEKILTSRAALEGERKQVTVLFADLKGSLELIADRDPEDAKNLLDTVLKPLIDAVHRYEGTVNSVRGDGIMAIFGAPIAHEHHAVRACYAALQMQDSIGGSNSDIGHPQGIDARIRVGLHSGEVVVRSVRNDLYMDYDAVGSTVHLANRMEQLAEPGTIRITSATYRLAEGFVVAAPLGPMSVKGIKSAVEVYELTGASATRSRLQAIAPQGFSRFVGRDRELHLLDHALSKADKGHGQIVALVGEPGVGKSRLAWEFAHRSRSAGWRVLETGSFPYGSAAPYHSVTDLLRSCFGIKPPDSSDRTKGKILDRLRSIGPSCAESMPALCSLLGLQADDAQWRTLDPSHKRQRTIEAVTNLLLEESRQQPLIIIFEDLQWIDTETEAVLDAIVDRLTGSRLMLLVDYRPGYQHGWGRKKCYAHIHMDPLSTYGALELLENLLGADEQLRPLKNFLIQRIDGNPFFLEESIRALVDSGVLIGARGAHRLVEPVRDLHVPATVQAVLAVRIDRLPPEEKRLLQSAAVVGRSFRISILKEVAQVPEHTLHQYLARLEAAEFLDRTASSPELKFSFKHALTHEVAYGTLLHEQRRTLHGRIVETIERLDDHQIVDTSEMLAHHAFRGEVWDKAVTYLRQAGARAIGRSVNLEATAFFEKALTALAHLPNRQDYVEEAIDLRLDLRTSLVPLGEHRRVLEYLREAEILAKQLSDQQRLGRIYSYMTQCYWLTARWARAMESGQQTLATASAHGEFGTQVSTKCYLGLACYSLGDYRLAIEYLRSNAEALQGSLSDERFGLTGLPSVLSRSWLAWCLAEVGDFAEGILHAQEGIRLAEAADQPLDRIQAYHGLGIVYLRRGHLGKAIPVLRQALDVCRAADMRLFLPRSISSLGYACALGGRVADALPLLEQGMDQASSMKLTVMHSLFLCWLAEAYLIAGRSDEALGRATAALDGSRQRSERGLEAWVLRLMGEIETRRDSADGDAAQECFQNALALADELGMRPLMAHCQLGLGRLYRDRTSSRSRDYLSAATAMFRDMDMPIWADEAKTLLTEVSDTPLRKARSPSAVARSGVAARVTTGRSAGARRRISKGSKAGRRSPT